MPAELTPALAAALGALQGVAEFLPISSSGHLALAEMLTGMDAASVGHSFNIVVHAGTLLAVLLHYRRDLLALTLAAIGRAPPRRTDRTGPLGQGLQDSQPDDARALLVALILGTLPLAAAVAPPVEQLVIFAEHTPRAVGAGFILTALMLLFAHRRATAGAQTVPRPWQAVLIGVAQLVAILPGISRSGSTMAAALALGLGRLPAARFSFLLSVPAILGASAKEALDLAKDGGPAIDPASFAVGFVVSFLVGALTLRLLIHLLVRLGLLPFVPYLLALAAAVFILT